MAELQEYQAELAEVVMGDGQPIVISTFDPGGKPEVTSQDASIPGEDGIVFGRDFLKGRVVTVEGAVDTENATDCRTQWAKLATAWNHGDTRKTPRAVVPLRLRMPGGDTVRVYGRPRKLTTSSVALVDVGIISFVADFQCVDGLVYSDTESTLTLTLPASDDTTITPPFTPPATPMPMVDVQGSVTNGGNASAWPVVTFAGPVTNPTFWYPPNGPELAVLAVVADGQTLTVDIRPWARTITRDDGALLAGKARGARMTDLAVPVGTVAVAFSGHDTTATAQMTVTFRDTWGSF
ncbi:MAG: hypothetical protein ACRDQA_03540 [Nocardioidaceae bacterium]